MIAHGYLKVSVCALFLCMVLSGAAKGDEVYGSIRGTVKDPSGATIPGVTVTATNPATGISRSVATSTDGTFEFVNLPAPATYTVAIEQAGFKRYEAQGIALALNQIYVLDVSMELGRANQAITVEANPTQVETTSIQLGARITGTAVVNLPLNGRNWVDLQKTLPGVVESMGDFDRNFATNGSRAQDNGFMVNGTDSVDLALNTPLVIPSPDAIAEVTMITGTINPEYARNGGAILNAVTKSGTNHFHGSAFDFYRDPFLNARNFFLPEPEQFHQNQFGGTVGGPIWKDHTFFFFSYQGTYNRQPIEPGRGFAGGTTAVFTADERNGYFPDLASSANASAFPLVGEDGATYAGGTPYSTIFPTGHIPAADISPIATNLISAYMPLPNLGSSQFSWNPVATNKNNQYITRIDHTFGPRDSLSGYWFIENDNAVEDEPFYGGSLPGFAEADVARVQNMNVTWNHTFGANAINEARVGYNRLGYNSTNPVKPVQPSSMGFTGINPQDTAGAGIPCIDMIDYEPPAGACLFGFSYDGPQPRIDQTYQLTDNLTVVHGEHTFKLGFDMRRAQVFNPFYFVNNGYFQFYGIGPYSTGVSGADFMLGVPDFYEQTSGGVIDARTQEYYSYFQDQWKIRPNLTLTYGVGWQVNTPQNDIYNGGVAINAFRPGQQSKVFPTAPEGLLFPGDPGISTSSYNTAWHNLGPRLGFAWSPDSGRKWSIRGGFGIYYNQLEEELTLQNLQAPPFSLTDFGIFDVGGWPSFAAPFTDVTGSFSIPNKYPFTPPKPGSTVDFGFFEPMVLKVFDPNLTTPSAYNYNLTIEHELGGSFIASIGYVGHLGRHLSQRYELNPAGQAPGVNPVCAADPNCLPNNMGFADPQTFRYDPLTFASIGVQATDGNSNYNSLQTTLTRRLSHGLEMQASYTWSHSLDTTSSVENVGGFGAPNPFDLRSNYGDSSYDARQRFVISYFYSLPSVRQFNAFHALPSRLTDGWEISGDTTFQTGFPLGLLDSSDGSLTCWQGLSSFGCPDRPNVTGPVKILNPRNAAINGRGNYYFDPRSFSPEVPGVLGNAGRNFFHGPGVNNWDFGVYKETRIAESVKIQLRFEFFNFFNHTQFDAPGTDINSPSNFGRVTAAAAPRIIQLAAKLQF
jgi:Carboxypeptidase regulatory-like domain